MKALFVYSTKFERYNGVYYSVTGTADLWNQRYLKFFDSLTVLGRVVDVDNADGKVLSSTDKVEFHCTTMGVNPKEYFTKKKQIEKFIENEVKNTDFVIARQSFFAAIAVKYAKKYGKPYLCEVVGSSWDSNWNYSLKGKLVAPYFELQAKNMIKDAKYVTYVTQKFLQKEYPCKCESIGVSNVVIQKQTDDILVRRLQKVENMKSNEISLMTTAAVNVRYKGQQFVIKAIPKLNKLGIKVKYHLVGDGDNTYLQNLATKLNVQDQVVFEGRKKLNEVFELLDSVDVYIQPSLQEGLPRSLVEAMSRGCISIGAKTAGIPELLQDEFVVKRKSVTGIVKVIRKICQNSVQENKEISKRNFEFAKNYDYDILTERRNRYFEKIINDLTK